jgi:hypothetical protein
MHICQLSIFNPYGTKLVWYLMAVLNDKKNKVPVLPIYRCDNKLNQKTTAIYKEQVE